MPVLVIIGYVWPEPKSSAAGYRMLSIIELFITQGWQVIFACAAEKTIHRADLAKLGVQEQQIALNDDSFDLWLSTKSVQAVMFDRFMLEEQFGWRVEKSCPDALRILDMEDMHALRHARHQAHKENRVLHKSDLNSEHAVREIAAIYRCDITLVISQYEMQLLQQHYAVPTALLCYCPFLVDTTTAIHQQTYEQRQHFVAIGNFRHAPNWQAVLWLKQTIWPLIRQQLPQSHLYIYGAYPPPKATALHNPKQGFYVKGWAEDVADVMQQARVCLAPLAFGAGLKGKLLDAMQFGTPSVTTDIGAEGMTLADEAWGGFIANTSIEIASAAVQLYQEPKLWLTAQQQGNRILQQQFSAAKWQPLIWQQIQHTIENLAQHRSLNFTGIMLQHHAYRSTKFMGQWIEAKNRLANAAKVIAKDNRV